MSQQSFSEKIILTLSLVGMFIFLSGTKACQEDYELGAQTNTGTDTPTASATADGGDEGTATLTPTRTATAVAATTEPTEVPEATNTPGGSQAAQEILNELALLNEPEKEKKDTSSQRSGQTAGSGKTSNWLGKAFHGNSEEGSGFDSDGDGYTDELENSAGTNPNDPQSVPPPPQIKLSGRMQAIDKDMDGFSNTKELQKGTDPEIPDTDGDGVADGLEIMAGTNPLDPNSSPVDSDNDGLSDSLEASRSTDSQDQDSDHDGINDGLEVILHSDPLAVDTDGDGILDGKEYELGSDPAQSEKE